MFEWWLALGDGGQLGVVTGALSVLIPVVVWVIRHWSKDFDVTTAQKKMLVACVLAFISGVVAAPGDWKQRLLAGVLAVVGSQFAYNAVQTARGERDQPADLARRMRRANGG